MNNRNSKVMIIGAGVAGCACAIQLKRQGYQPILLERAQVGGLARNANRIENYPGFPKGLTGEEFCTKLEEQLRELAIDVIQENITNVSWNKPQTTFLLEGEKQNYSCHYLVMATGTKPKKLNVEREETLKKEGKLFYEPKNLPEKLQEEKKVIIIGGGDAAFDYALKLAGKKNHVTIIHRSRKFACLPLLHERAINNKKIAIRSATSIEKIDLKTEKNEVEVSLDDKSKLTADYLLVAVGREPNTIVPPKKLFKKKIENSHLFLAGDLKEHPFRQIAIAAGSGIKTAMKIGRKIAQDKKNAQPK